MPANANANATYRPRLAWPANCDSLTLGRSGKLTASGATAGANVSYVYDAAGRLTSTTANGKTLSFQLDPAGNRTRTTWPDTSFYTTTNYDALNRPINIKELGSANLASYAYDDLSRRTTVTLGNNTSTSYGYDTHNNLSSLAHDLSGTAQDISYGYSRNLLNEIGRQSFSNDAYQWAGVPGNATNGTRNYTTNGLNQYTSAAGDTLSYNPRGLLNVNGPWIYRYDINERLTSASKNVAGAVTSGTMAYDAEGRLNQTVINLPTPSTSTRNQLYDGVNMVADYDGADVLMRRYVHGPGVDEPLVIYEGAGTGTKNWQYADHLGSIIGTADSTGASTAIFSYGPFGESSPTSGQH